MAMRLTIASMHTSNVHTIRLLSCMHTFPHEMIALIHVTSHLMHGTICNVSLSLYHPVSLSNRQQNRPARQLFRTIGFHCQSNSYDARTKLQCTTALKSKAPRKDAANNTAHNRGHSARCTRNSSRGHHNEIDHMKPIHLLIVTTRGLNISNNAT